MSHATTTSQDPSADLDRLDRALLAARQWARRPGHRRRFWEQLAMPIQLTTVRVLRAVENAEGEDPTIGDVASALGVDPSTASRFIDRVVERGELRRRACTMDRRRTRVTLTPAGHDTLDAVRHARRHVLNEVTHGWDPEDLRLLASLLERLGERFDELECRE